MKVLLSWLKEYVNIDMSAEELAHKLTNTGLEVEGIEYIGENFKDIIIGEITDIIKDENSKNLFVCSVKTGNNKKITVVTAADNVFKEAKVPVALPGTILPNGKKIVETTINNLKSYGMLCSKLELKLSDYATGILILPDNAEVGKSINTLINDVVLDIAITPNRSDCLSIKGVAREIAAITNQKMKEKDFKLTETNEKAADNLSIDIIDFDKCKRYVGKVIKDVSIKPAPFNMNIRLELSGVRSINNIVDVTNYVLLELGHPLHAFDYDTLKGNKIIVRCADKNEKITTIDDNERKLEDSMLVIADEKVPVAVAGVMGGKWTEVGNKTRNIMLESAWFSPDTIRKTSKKLKLHSEAAYRFERGTDIDKLKYAADYAAYLIVKYSSGKLCQGTVDTNNGFDTFVEVSLKTENVKKLLGITISEKDMIKYLELLELKVSKTEKGIINVKIPTHRNDISREVDLIEEIARIYGFDKIEATNPKCDLTYGWSTDYDNLINKIRTNLAFKGFKEIITYSFSSKEEVDLYNKRDNIILKEYGEFLEINNPISADASLMRPTLTFTMLNTLKLNSHIKNHGTAFFEIGKVFGKINRNHVKCSNAVDKDIIKHTVSEELPFEKELLGIILSEPYLSANWLNPSTSSSNTSKNLFYLLKSYVNNLLKEIKLNEITFTAADFSQFQKGQSASIHYKNEVIGIIGKINPDISEYYDLPNSVFFAEINIETINSLEKKEIIFKPFSKYPSVSRDIAVVIKEDILYNNISNEILSLNIDLLENFEIIDVYKGKPIEDGYKNIAITFTYRSNEKTLNENDINETHNKIFEMLVNKFNAKTR